ncbi:MAG: hypothetical protein AAGI15_08045 [Pseudomonadota bacterium]
MAPVRPIEVYGEHDYREPLPNGWTFALLRQRDGWSLRLFAASEGRSPVDLSSVTPPFRGPNTRDLFGWHFRNADNTGPNAGAVNAPQHFRPFEFSPALIGTGGFKPPPEITPQRPAADGRGWLAIDDLGLADLAPGSRARMNYLRATGCLTWPRSDAERRDFAFQTELTYADEAREIIGRCGLDLERFALRALVAPRHLSADFDGDGAMDDVMQIVDPVSGVSDVAICRAGTWLTRVGTLAPAPGIVHALSALERIAVVARDFASPGAPGGETTWPDAQGEVLVLERQEKSLYLVFMQRGQFQVRPVYGGAESGSD